MKRTRGMHYLILVVALLGCNHNAEKDDLVDPQDLGLKALTVKAGMARPKVIEILGPATWAALPGDSGDFGVKDEQTGLVLFWRNPGLAVVEVHFDKNNLVRWDGGHPLGADTYSHFFEPSPAFDCSLPDRAQYCR